MPKLKQTIAIGVGKNQASSIRPARNVVRTTSDPLEMLCAQVWPPGAEIYKSLPHRPLDSSPNQTSSLPTRRSRRLAKPKAVGVHNFYLHLELDLPMGPSWA
jgi:hypothetical protein